MRAITGRQTEVLQVIYDFVREKGFPPSIKEIGDLMGIGTLGGVVTSLNALARKGYLTRSRVPRSILLQPSAYDLLCAERPIWIRAA